MMKKMTEAINFHSLTKLLAICPDKTSLTNHYVVTLYFEAVIFFLIPVAPHSPPCDTSSPGDMYGAYFLS